MFLFSAANEERWELVCNQPDELDGAQVYVSYRSFFMG